MNEYSLCVEYTLRSYLEDLRNLDEYISDYFANIYTEDDNDNLEKIGQLSFRIVHLSRLPGTASTYKEAFGPEYFEESIASRILDFDNDDLKESILEHYNFNFIGHELVIIDQLEICEKYRGKGIGTLVLEDLFLRHGGNCRLVVMEAEPLQFQPSRDRQKEWNEKLNLKSLDRDYEKSKLKLLAFCQRSHMTPIEGFEGLVFFNPGWTTPHEDKDEDIILYSL
ncbi:MAG: hypothetical protein RH981_14145 [Arenibacter sp.]